MGNRTKALMGATLAVATLAAAPNAMAADATTTTDNMGVSARDPQQDAVATAQERVDKACLSSNKSACRHQLI